MHTSEEDAECRGAACTVAQRDARSHTWSAQIAEPQKCRKGCAAATCAAATCAACVCTTAAVAWCAAAAAVRAWCAAAAMCAWRAATVRAATGTYADGREQGGRSQA